VDGSRLALIVACDEYADEGLSQLRAPAHDAAALADVLRDPAIGAFEVEVLHNQPAHLVRRAVDAFFRDGRPDDLLVLHFSCHGVKNAGGALFLAMPDTDPTLLAATGVPSSFVNEMMSESRARRIALFLDCCYGGAFPKGMVVKAGKQAVARDTFAEQLEVADGRGHVVVTASDAMQYSFEGSTLTDHDEQPSVFTGALVEALSTGAADRDGDGWVGVNELFDYVEGKVRAATPHQRPQMWTFGVQGDIRLARSRPRKVVPTPLGKALTKALASPVPDERFEAVTLLRERLAGEDLGRALAAWQALSRHVGDDNERVADAVAAALAAAALRVVPPSLELTVDHTGTATADVGLDGPPLARATNPRTGTPWIRISQPDSRQLHVVATPPQDPGVHTGAVRIRSPIGARDLPVRVTVPAKRASSGRRLPLVVAGAGLAVVLAVAGAALWLGRDDGAEGPSKAGDAVALPTGPTLPKSAVLWVDKSADQDDGKWTVNWATNDSEAKTLFSVAPERLAWPVLLPDRQTVLYEGLDSGGGSLHVVGTDGRDDRILDLTADECVHLGRPSVNDGGLIAVNCFDEDNVRLPGIWIFDELGRFQRTVDDDNLDGNPTWAGHGKFLVFWRTIESANAQNLYATKADDSAPAVRLTSGVVCDSMPAVSPAGKRVVFLRTRASDTASCVKPGPGNPGQLYLLSIDPADPTRDPEPPVSGLDVPDSAFQPAWKSQGEVMYTDSGSGSAYALPIDDGEPAELWTDKIDGTAFMLFAAH
jgi:hypothetical protein